MFFLLEESKFQMGDFKITQAVSKNHLFSKKKKINNDKPHPKSSNDLLVCNLPLTLSLPKQCMQLEYMQGILSLSWNDCYVLYLIIY